MGRRVEESVEEEGCRTPTAEESRIPEEPTACPPPPPRKRRAEPGPAHKAAAAHKGKGGFFAPPEIEAFFAAHKAS